MDFLLLLPHGVRIVLEVDGKQHYAEGDTASPKLYSEMVSEDRRLRLRGYEVYRFGGYELTIFTRASPAHSQCVRRNADCYAYVWFYAISATSLGAAPFSAPLVQGR